jgi:hypothetical protein
MFVCAVVGLDVIALVSDVNQDSVNKCTEFLFLVCASLASACLSREK